MLLITGKSVPLPNAAQLAGEGDEIVRTRLKNRDNVNPLVPGSSPGGPTKSLIHSASVVTFAYGRDCFLRYLQLPKSLKGLDNPIGSLR